MCVTKNNILSMINIIREEEKKKYLSFVHKNEYRHQNKAELGINRAPAARLKSGRSRAV